MALFRPLVLMYHAVSDDWDDPLAVRIGEFEEQLRRLVDRGFRGATAAEVVRGARDRRLLHVTFDDGFRSVENGLPILERLELPATIFACSDLAAEGLPLRVAELEHGTSLEERNTLTWDRFRELTKSPFVAVGSHTQSHAHLTQLSAEDLARELRGSKEAIEAELQQTCDVVAYPYGEHDERVRKAAAAAGYDLGFAAPGRSLNFDVLELPRTGLWRNESRRRFDAKTRLSVRVARELGLTPTRGSTR